MKRISLLALLLLAGCATGSGIPWPEIPRERTAALAPSAPRHLKDDFSYPVSVGLGGTGSVKRVGLVAGTYQVVLEDAYGTFYRGPDWCVAFYRAQSESTVWYQKDGGLWVPKDSSRFRPRIFAFTYGRKESTTGDGGVPTASPYVNPTPLQAGLAVAAPSILFAAMASPTDKNKITLWPEIPTTAGAGQELLLRGEFTAPSGEPTAPKRD